MPDVFVIGGGPAGLAAAIAARRKGFSVTLADARRPPIDKACGEGLLPDTVVAARALGLDLRACDAFAIRGVRFHGAGVSVKSAFRHERGLGMRRTALHQALVDHAGKVGVDLQWGRSVSGLDAIAARWVIGADGMSSRVRGWAGLDEMVRDSRRYGFRRHYSVAPWSDYIETYWGNRVQAYVTPVAADRVGIAILTSDPKVRVDDALLQFPELRARLAGAAFASSERGALTPTRRFKNIQRGNVALVGDASGSVDAITGEGISLGFHQALALADVMALSTRNAGNLRGYEKAHARIARRPRFMGDLMLLMDRWPLLRDRALATMSLQPRIFDALVAFHVGG